MDKRELVEVLYRNVRAENFFRLSAHGIFSCRKIGTHYEKVNEKQESAMKTENEDIPARKRSAGRRLWRNEDERTRWKKDVKRKSRDSLFWTSLRTSKDII